MFEKPQIREFSQEFSEKERDETAAKIRESRKAHFDRKSELDTKLDELIKKCENTKLSLEELERELSDIETELSEQERSSFGKLLDYIGLNRRLDQLKKNKETKEIEQVGLEEEFDEVKAIIHSLEKSRLDRSHLDAAKKILADFYITQEKALAEFITEQESIRSVSAISEKHEVVFLHGIHPTFVPDNNSLLHRSVDWQTKLDIFLAFNPTISASTIVKGDKSNKMWARQGCILTEGFVVDASSTDAGTVAEDIGGRRTGSFKRKMNESDIYSAINFRRDRHNEFVVARPKIAGFFICREKNDRDLPDLAPIPEIVSECKRLNIPLFEIKNGEVWETLPTSDGNDVVASKLLDTSEVLKKEFDLPESDRERIENEILSDSPFTALPSEGKYIISNANGRELYILLNKDKFLGKEGREEVFSNPAEKRTDGLKSGTTVRFLDEFPTVGGKVRYIATQSGDIFRHAISSYRPKSEVNPESDGRRNISSTDTRAISSYDTHSIRTSSYINLAFNSHDVGRPIINTSAYLKGIESSLLKVVEMRNETVNEKLSKAQKERVRVGLEEWVNQIAFHIYGFAEQARGCGDTETADNAFKIIESVMPVERCKEIIEERVDNDGRFRIKKEEIKK